METLQREEGKVKKEKKKKKIQYMNDKILLLDIETSTIECNDGSKVQETYLANVLEIDLINMCIGQSYFFRNLNEVVCFFNEITNEDVRYICYCHNLDYELTHILRETMCDTVRSNDLDIYNMAKCESVFRDKHSPISVILEDIPFINFRCSYALFNKTVAQLGKEVDLPKLDYDYKKVRTPYDELEEIDYEYNKRDNEIVALSLLKRWKERKEEPFSTPLTFTASTKLDRHKFIKNKFGDSGLRALNMDKNLCFNSLDFYDMCVKVYQGGLTTANKSYFNSKIENSIMSIDITSSYPYQMVTRRYPIYLEETTSYFESDEANDFYLDYLHGIHFEDLKGESGISGYFAEVTLRNIKIYDENYLLPLSESKCYIDVGVEKTIINGKVYSCDELTVYVDNVTLQWINDTYTYDDIYVSKLYVTTKDRQLRLSELSFILDGFNTKQKLKAKEQRGEELTEEEKLSYALAKVNINSMYGVKVQKPLKDRYDIINGEIVKLEFNDEFDYNDTITQEEVYQNFLDMQNESMIKNNKGKNFDIFTDGIYITAYARYMLIDMMIRLTELGCICIYTDTDSLKFIVNENSAESFSSRNNTKNNNISNNTITKVTQFISEVNKQIIKENSNNFRFNQYKQLFNVPNTDYERILPLGTWDIENKRDKNGNVLLYPYFKTLGAKKYAIVSAKYDKESETIKEEIKTTIAGCSKKVSETITKYCKLNNLSLNDGLDIIFDVGTEFDLSCSGRTTALREKRSLEEMYTLRYKHNNKRLIGNGGIIIEDTSYTLNISENDEDVLELTRECDVIRTINFDGELKYVD